MKTKLLNYWLSEEKRVFKGWNFDSINEFMTEEKLPWNYRNIVKPYIKENIKILDMGTGGGEFLLSLKPYKGVTYATEAYPLNYEYSKEKLKNSGIEFIFVKEDSKLNFKDNFFDVIINKHESFDSKEVSRILKSGGVFITQQVGGKNNCEFAKNYFNIISNYSINPTYLKDDVKSLEESGFEILEKKECFPSLRFSEVGAFVYFAKIIEWEFPGFSVNKYLKELYELHNEIEKLGYIELKEHRFLIVAKLI